MLCEEDSLNILPDKNVRSESPDGFDSIPDKGTCLSTQPAAVAD